MIVETEAVVLHAMNYGDTSKIVTLYSRKFGKVKVIAKGARNPKTNKFGSSLEPLTNSSVVFYKKEHRDLHLLSKSEIAQPLNRMQDDTEKMFTGLAVIELVNMVMHDEEENEKIFQLLRDSLVTIDSASKNIINVFIAFELQLFKLFGFGLSIDECVHCGKKTAEAEFSSVALRLSDGKFICSGCSDSTNASGIKINGGMLRSMFFLHSNEVTQSCSLQIAPAMKDEILATLQSYLRYHIEGTRTIRSLSLLYNSR